MDRIIAASNHPNATDATVLGNVDGKVPSSPLQWTFDDYDTHVYFTTLLGMSTLKNSTTTDNNSKTKTNQQQKQQQKTPPTISFRPSHEAMVGLLALPTRQIQQLSESISKQEEEEIDQEGTHPKTDDDPQLETNLLLLSSLDILPLYLKAVSIHIESLIYVWNSFFVDVASISTISTVRLIVDIVKVCFIYIYIYKQKRFFWNCFLSSFICFTFCFHIGYFKKKTTNGFLFFLQFM